VNDTDYSRLIEHAFPLKQASLDSVHEKNVRHGHISTLHIWPARRPLAACRAALIATLLPDPGTPEERKKLCEKIGGKVVRKDERKTMPNGKVVVRDKYETEGGILHWGRETSNAADLEWFRQEIRKAYGGRAPRVLDPFAGGGAIPLEAMRLGCEATAVDINPVAWFILKCTLEYPQKLAGKTHPLPDFILDNEEFMEAFYKANPHLAGRTKPTKKQLKEQANKMWKEHDEENERAPKADLAWHVRAWGQWVLDRARRELAKYYPVYADFEPIKKGERAYEPQSIKLVPLKDDGIPDIDALNAEFSPEYVKDETNPRWIAKPTVAYLWAHTVTCKNCRATIPLLKTRWLCKKTDKRVVLAMEPNPDKTWIVFSIQHNVPVKGGNVAQRREHDKRLGDGTMSRSGAKCPCCPTIMTKDDIKVEGRSNRMGQQLMAVVVDGPAGREYRTPTPEEVSQAENLEDEVVRVFQNVPFGLPREPITPDGKGSTWCIQYGVTTFDSLFSTRQLVAMGTLIKLIREVQHEFQSQLYADDWRDAVTAYLQLAIDRFASFSCKLVRWKIDAEAVVDAFARFGLPLLWDYAEAVPVNGYAGGFQLCFERIFTGLSGTMQGQFSQPPLIRSVSAIQVNEQEGVDVILTDPPYYDAISYSAIMDFFYVWLRRGLSGLREEYTDVFKAPLAPKWDHEGNDGELIDDAQRFEGDRQKSKIVYENGMARAFTACHRSLVDSGQLVIVFANKQPDAWETLVSAIIRAGFVVDGSWPIQTEMVNRARALSSAALASSVWLVCKKRLAAARPGWDNRVLEEMKTNITHQLREFWDAGIKGPDFVWAATGPALEAYSKHPVVKKANDPGQVMSVGEFLHHVRRMVVDFIVGQVLTGHEGDSDMAAADRLDEPSAYYLLHRNDFRMGDAPAGTCILYAVSCGLSDRDLDVTWDILARTGGAEGTASGVAESEAEYGEEEEPAEGSGSTMRLKPWNLRRSRSMGYEAPAGRPVPLIDRIHRLMHLWKEGDLHKVDAFLDDHGLRKQELFRRVLQSLIELSEAGSEERSILESLSNHVQAKGAVRKNGQRDLFVAEPTNDYSSSADEEKET